MHRRQVLTAALALPAQASAICIGVRPYGDPAAGSSVSPAGSYSTSVYCPQQPLPVPQWIPHWPAGTRQAFDADAWTLCNGSTPLPSSTVVVSSPFHPTVESFMTPGQYMDHRDLAAMVGISIGTAAISQTGPRQYAFSNGYAAGAAFAWWIGWNTGTFIHLNAVAVDAWIRTNIGPAAWLGGMSAAQGDALRAQIGSGGGVLIIRLR